MKEMDLTPFRHLYPFESRYMEIDALSYHYIDEGSGEPIVMVHGNPTWSFYYRSLISALSPTYRAIAPDHIGCGLSEKPDANRYDYRLQSRVDNLETFLERLGLNDDITLVLHDWGGMIGMTYAVKYPERIRRIILLNTAAFFPPGAKPLPFRLRLARNTGFLSTGLILGCNLFAYSALWMASRQGLSKAVKQGLLAPYNNWHNRTATLKFVRDIPINEKDPSYPVVRRVDKGLHRLKDHPFLICWGAHDFVFDRDYLAEWERRFPDAEVHRYPEAGHYVLEDAAEDIVARIQSFLDRHPLR